MPLFANTYWYSCTLQVVLIAHGGATGAVLHVAFPVSSFRQLGRRNHSFHFSRDERVSMIPDALLVDYDNHPWDVLLDNAPSRVKLTRPLPSG